MAIFGGFGKQGIRHVVHKICNHNIIFRKSDILPFKMISISTCYRPTSGRVISLLEAFFQPRPLHYMSVTRGSAIAEEPRDALRQLKYYGRF